MQAWLASQYDMGKSSKPLMGEYEIIKYVHEEHLSMCLEIWRHYPMALDAVLKNYAYVNRYLEKEMKRPKVMGSSQDRVEFLLQRLASIVYGANYSGNNFENDFEEMMKMPWDTE